MSQTRDTSSGIKEAVLAFLAEHRGDAYCTDCVAHALAIKNPDAGLRAAEGHGAWRRHGYCTWCGRARLVSRLAPIAVADGDAR